MKEPTAIYEVDHDFENDIDGYCVADTYSGIIRVKNGFEIKEDLKKRGYTWYGHGEYWWKKKSGFATTQPAKDWIEAETMALEKELGVYVDDKNSKRG